MKKAFIAVGLAFVAFVATVDYLQASYKLQHQHEEIASTYEK
jgi:hypothetical protein